jgi:SAM-dependent methyltransferase
MTVLRSFDRVADVYDATRGGEARGAQVAADIAPWLAPGPVLEVCIGTGLVAAALPRPCYGVDLSAAMLARAVDRLGTGRLVRGNALALPFRSSTLDNVVFVAALHVIGDVTGAIAEAARVLRPGGRIVAHHAPWIREPSDMKDAVEPLTKLFEPLRPDVPAAIDAAAAAAGLRLVDRTISYRVREDETPNGEADSIEGRLWSALWDVDETTWRDVVMPVVARLRALPDPDRPRAEVSHCQLSIYTR